MMDLDPPYRPCTDLAGAALDLNSRREGTYYLL